MRPRRSNPRVREVSAAYPFCAPHVEKSCERTKISGRRPPVSGRRREAPAVPCSDLRTSRPPAFSLSSAAAPSPIEVAPGSRCHLRLSESSAIPLDAHPGGSMSWPAAGSPTARRGGAGSCRHTIFAKPLTRGAATTYASTLVPPQYAVRGAGRDIAAGFLSEPVYLCFAQFEFHSADGPQPIFSPFPCFTSPLSCCSGDVKQGVLVVSAPPELLRLRTDPRRPARKPT
jgi:hypothetical protein